MNQYDIQKVVGQGSYGRAILCKRKKDSKLCIIKQISMAKLSKKEAKMTEQEAMLLGKLQHPNIVQFWESFVNNANLHIVMEFADGGDLDSYVKNYIKSSRGKEMPEAQVLNLFVQICLAIKHIHDRKILHRDLKGQNVFLTSSGLCKVGDFGVSRVLRSTVELASTQIGTPYYMSPEIMNSQKYNSKTDIWSLGIILYELVCLRLPFQGSSMKQLCYNIINATPASPSSVYSKEMRELVRDILAKDPRKRPSVNNILARPIIKGRIQNFLNETKLHKEFSHTVLHGAYIFNPASQPQPAPVPVQQIKATPIPSNLVQNNARPINPPPQVIPQPQKQPIAAAVVPTPQQPQPQQKYVPAPAPISAAKFIQQQQQQRYEPPKSVQDIIKNMLRPALVKQQQGQAVIIGRPSSAVNNAPQQQQQQQPPPVVNNGYRPSSAAANAKPVVPKPFSYEPSQKPNIINNAPVPIPYKEVPKAAAAPFLMAPSKDNNAMKAQQYNVPQPQQQQQQRPAERQAPKPAPVQPNLVRPTPQAAAVVVPFIPMREIPKSAVVQPSPRIAPRESPRVINIPAQAAQREIVKPKEDANNNMNMKIVGAGVSPQIVIGGGQQRVEKKIEVIPKPNIVVRESPRGNYNNNNDAAGLMKYKDIPKAAVGGGGLHRENSGNNIKVVEKMDKIPSNVIENAKRKEANSEVSTPRTNASDRMKAIDIALGKAAAVLDVVKQEKERVVGKYEMKGEKNVSPVPFSEPVVAPKVVANNNKNINVNVVENKVANNPTNAAAGQPWLADLQNQMGALKVQVQQLQANRNPSNPPPSLDIPSRPVAVPVTPISDPVDLSRLKAPSSQQPPKAINRSASEKANVRASRQSFPVSKNDLPNPALAKMKKNVAVINEKYNSPKVPGVIANQNIPKSNANKRAAEVGHLKVKINAPSKPKVMSPPPDSKESLEQRKEMREKHRAGFREFLQAQRVVNGHDHSHINEDEESVEAIEEPSVVNMNDEFFDDEISHENISHSHAAVEHKREIVSSAYPKKKDGAFLTDLVSSSHISSPLPSLESDSILTEEPSIASKSEQKKLERERERVEFRKLIYEKRHQQQHQQQQPSHARDDIVMLVSEDVSIVAPKHQIHHRSPLPSSVASPVAVLEEKEDTVEDNKMLFEKSTGQHSLAAALAKEQAKGLQASMQRQAVGNQQSDGLGKQFADTIPDTMMFNQQDILSPENAACCTMWGSYFRTTHNAKILPTSPVISRELQSAFMDQTPQYQKQNKTIPSSSAKKTITDDATTAANVSFNEAEALAPFESEEIIQLSNSRFPQDESAFEDSEILPNDPFQEVYEELQGMPNEDMMIESNEEVDPTQTVGNSVVEQWHADPSIQIIDDQAALEYSLMLQQMQEILHLPSAHAHHHHPSQPSSKKSQQPSAKMMKPLKEEQEDNYEAEAEEEEEGDCLEEEIEEGFEEASVSYFLSDTEDDMNNDNDYDNDNDQDGNLNSDFEEIEEGGKAGKDEGELMNEGRSEKDNSLQYTKTTDRTARRVIDGEENMSTIPREMALRHGRRHSDSALLTYHAGQLQAEQAGGEGDSESVRVHAFDETMSSERLVDGGSADNYPLPPMEDDFQLMTILQEKLIENLGVSKYEEGMGFLQSAFLVDEAMEDDQLLTMLEEIIGEDNLPYLEDMYQLFTLQQTYA